MIYGAVAAGGIGSRLGDTDRPKQFLPIGGRPVLVHTVDTFLGCSELDKIIVLVPQEWIDFTEELINEYFEDVSRIAVIGGGDTRNETVMNAITYIEESGGLDDETIIVTHDAVRPFVTERMIRENIEAVCRTGACETAFPATDTVVRTDDGRFVAEVPDRACLYNTQTPQTFRAKHLRELYLSLTEEEKKILTDAAKIYVIKGEPVEIVMGESYNIKITYPHDIAVAEAILQTRIRT